MQTNILKRRGELFRKQPQDLLIIRGERVNQVVFYIQQADDPIADQQRQSQFRLIVSTTGGRITQIAIILRHIRHQQRLAMQGCPARDMFTEFDIFRLSSMVPGILSGSKISG